MIDNEEVVQPQEETTANPEVQSVEPEVKQEAAPVQEAQQESSKEKNFRILRERAERAERERDELLRSNQPKPQEEDDLGLGNDDYAEGKHLRKLKDEIKQLKQQMATSHVESAEMRLKAQHSDFDKIVSKENLEALRNEYPELAQTLNNTPDLYVKAKSAYTMIKKLGIGQEEIDISSERDREIAKKNMAKPKPMASISPGQTNSPLSKANAFQNDYSDAALKEAYKEMRQILGKE